jgi:hypothetical protein
LLLRFGLDEILEHAEASSRAVQVARRYAHPHGAPVDRR